MKLVDFRPHSISSRPLEYSWRYIKDHEPPASRKKRWMEMEENRNEVRVIRKRNSAHYFYILCRRWLQKKPSTSLEKCRWSKMRVAVKMWWLQQKETRWIPCQLFAIYKIKLQSYKGAVEGGQGVVFILRDGFEERRNIISVSF